MPELMMVLSTAHIDQETAFMLANDIVTTQWGLVVYSKDEYGWFISVSEDCHADVPHDIRACLRYAYLNHCQWLCLDRDGDIVDELPVYDW